MQTIWPLLLTLHWGNSGGNAISELPPGADLDNGKSVTTFELHIYCNRKYGRMSLIWDLISSHGNIDTIEFISGPQSDGVYANIYNDKEDRIYARTRHNQNHTKKSIDVADQENIGVIIYGIWSDIVLHCM